GETVIRRRRRDVQRKRTAGPQVFACEREELLRRELEGHVRLPVRVDDDQVVALVAAREERPAVCRDQPETTVLPRTEEAARHVVQLSVDLDAVDVNPGVEAAVRTRD